MKLQWFIVAITFWVATSSIGYAQSSNEEGDDVKVSTDAIEISTQQAQELAESLNLPDGFAEGARTDDVFYQMMKKIIGQPLADVTAYTDNVDPSAGSGGGNITVMTWLISIMAGVGLIATALAGVFFLVVGLARSNISGSFAGRNEGGAGWYFGRIGLASVLNMPLSSAGGLAISQVMMLVILLMGIGAGSSVFREASSRMLTQPLITYSHENIEKLYISALRARMCMVYAVEHGFIEPEDARWFEGSSLSSSWSSTIDGAIDYAKNWYTAESDSLEVKYYNYGPTGECGNLAINIPRQSETSIVEDFVTKYTLFGGLVNAGNSLSEGNGDNIETFILGNMGAATLQAVLDLHQDVNLQNAILQVVEQQASPGKTPETEAFVPAILSSYNSFRDTISYALAQTTQDLYCYSDDEGGLEGSGYRSGCKYNAQLTESVSELGFAVAGSYTWILAERQTELIDAINEATAKEVTVDFEGKLVDWDVEVSDIATQSAIFMYRSADLALKKIASMKSGTLSDSLNRSYELSTTDGAIAEAAGDLLKNTWRGIIEAGNSATGDWENPEPLIMMRAIGNTMLNVPVILGALDIAASFTPPGRIAKTFGGASKALGSIDKRKNKSFTEDMIGSSGGYFLELFLSTLFFIGVFLAIVVPAIPMVMWNTAIAGYFLYAIMVVAGTPIMVAAKTMDANSEGLVGAAKTGYYMAFNLFLRPTLMVAGLIIAMAVSRVLSWLWNATFFETFQMTQSGTGSIASVIGYPMIWGIGTMVIIYKSYGLINDLAATIMKMFGAEGEHSMFNEEQDKDRLIAVMSQTSSSMRPSTKPKPKSTPTSPEVEPDKQDSM